MFAFAVTILVGVAVGNPATAVLSRALWAMAAFFLLGSVLGYIALRVIDEYAVRRHEELLAELRRADPSAPAGDEANAPRPSESAVEAGRP